jgi:formamidopyrimidine-DNA glycosylase
MPELPEVETVRRSLEPHVTGRLIRELVLRARRVAAPSVAGHAAGRRILRLGRVGKYLIFELDQGVLTVHLRMTGKLLHNGAPGPYTRAIFELDRGSVCFDDTRQFGRIEWAAGLPARVQKLGPEPFAISAAEFAARLHARRGAVKPLLLNQQFVAGLGNIYADESLYRARIHPLQTAGTIGAARARHLHAAMVEVLNEAIAAGGSSISDYVNATGEAGTFQVAHQAYGRTGKPCARCGTAIQRIVVGQRSTHFCPRCQRLQ